MPDRSVQLVGLLHARGVVESRGIPGLIRVAGTRPPEDMSSGAPAIQPTALALNGTLATCLLHRGKSLWGW
jgi:hypothetical protein